MISRQTTTSYRESFFRSFLFSHAKNFSHALYTARITILLPIFFCIFPSSGYADTDNLVSEILRLARQGDAQAQFSLAMMHDQGYSLPHSPQKAVHWLTKAAEQNLPAACLYLGMKYEFGNGVGQDKKIAERWYKQAARQNWAMAQYLLALLYLDERKTIGELLTAAAWLQQASKQDYPGAREKLQEILQQLTDDEKRRVSAIDLQLIKPTGKSSIRKSRSHSSDEVTSPHAGRPSP